MVMTRTATVYVGFYRAYLPLILRQFP